MNRLLSFLLSLQRRLSPLADPPQMGGAAGGEPAPLVVVHRAEPTTQLLPAARFPRLTLPKPKPAAGEMFIQPVIMVCPAVLYVNQSDVVFTLTVVPSPPPSRRSTPSRRRRCCSAGRASTSRPDSDSGLFSTGTAEKCLQY